MNQPRPRRRRRTSEKKMFQTFDFQFFSRFWYCPSIVSINPKKSKKNTKELLKYRRKSSNEKLYIRCVTSAFFSLLHVCARDWFKRVFHIIFLQVQRENRRRERERERKKNCACGVTQFHFTHILFLSLSHKWSNFNFSHGIYYVLCMVDSLNWSLNSKSSSIEHWITQIFIHLIFGHRENILSIRCEWGAHTMTRKKAQINRKRERER